MKFLADESCDFAVVRSLRAAGFDVVAVCEASPRVDDGEVLARASSEKMVLVTEDKDFGDLVYRQNLSACGVIMLRYPNRSRKRIALDILSLIEREGEKLAVCFVVLQPGKVRISRPIP